MSIGDTLSNTVFLLGAGASMDAGCHNSKQMLDDLVIKINSIVEQDKKQIYLEIYTFIIATLRFKFSIESASSSEEEIINIEDFVMLLRQLIFKDFILPDPLINAWNNKILKWELRSYNVFSKFYDFVLENLIKKWTRFNPDQSKSILAPLRQLVSHESVKRIDFFTLNYDLIFEDTFNCEGEHALETGFSRNIWRANFDEASDTKIKYFKLHGSLDWHYDSENEEIELTNSQENNNPLLIFGMGEKVVTIDPFLFLLGEFRKKLESAKLYIIIGYSFSDQHINNLIIQNLKAKTSRKMIVVDPKYSEHNKDKLLQYIAKVQNKKLYYDTKNLSKISPEKIEILKIGAKDFYSEYFGDYGKKLINCYNSLHDQEFVF